MSHGLIEEEDQSSLRARVSALGETRGGDATLAGQAGQAGQTGQAGQAGQAGQDVSTYPRPTMALHFIATS